MRASIFAFLLLLGAGTASAATAAGAKDAAPPLVTNYHMMTAIEAEQLVHVAQNLDVKEGSLLADLRKDLLKLAHQLDATVAGLKDAEAAKKPAMSADDTATDKQLRDAVEARRKAATTCAIDAQSGLYQPADAAEELLMIRCEVIAENIAFANHLSLAPNRIDGSVRQSILAGMKTALGTAKEPAEKEVAKTLTDASARTYEPWTGTWKCRWGTLELTQHGDNVTGTMDNDGKVKGRVQHNTLVGQYVRDNEQGSFTFTLPGDDDDQFEAAIKKGNVSDAWKAIRIPATAPAKAIDKPAEKGAGK